MKSYKGRARFHLYLTLFMLSMLGLVLADNLMLLFVFWELTTLTSYLLIGFNHEKALSRRNALQALLITGSGGLCLLAGLILLGEMAGSYNITAVLSQAQALQQHAFFIPSLILILLGAFTKSAQFPFHFWLPGAMAAPTPVSAYLHSSTMVKAGVYLLARVLPIYGESDLWLYTLCIFGAFTALWCAILAYKQTDLKLMLAYSTNAILGQLVLLLGLNSSYAITAALLLICAHAFYKAGLFMVVGNIDKATGTREYRELAGLRTVLSISFIAALITAASKAGLPPSFGFLSKEYIYKAGLEFDALLAVVMLLVNALMVAISLLIVIKPFFKKHHPQAATIKPIEQNYLLWVPPLILSIGSVLVPLALIKWYQDLIINPAMQIMLPGQPLNTVHLFSGFNLPLLLSAITLCIGIGMYLSYTPIQSFLNRLFKHLPQATDVFQHIINGLIEFSQRLTRFIQHGTLSKYTLQFFIILLSLLSFGVYQINDIPVQPIDAYYYEIVLAVFLCIAAFAVVYARTLLLAIAALGVIGFLNTLIFLIYSAPDVAKTQLLVEILLVVFIAIVLRHIPAAQVVKSHRASRSAINAFVAVTIGAALSLLLWEITATALNTDISDFYATNSLSGGHGRNIVNVILVDFRAFDTLGEIVVVVIAAIAAVALLPRLKRRVTQVSTTPKNPDEEKKDSTS